MTVQGTLCTPFVLGSIELIDALPYGGLVTPYEIEERAVDVVSTITLRFPVPPIAWGFLTDADYEPVFDKVVTTVAGAVYPESIYLEPTIGQIWPR